MLNITLNFRKWNLDKSKSDVVFITLYEKNHKNNYLHFEFLNHFLKNIMNYLYYNSKTYSIYLMIKINIKFLISFLIKLFSFFKLLVTKKYIKQYNSWFIIKIYIILFFKYSFISWRNFTFDSRILSKCPKISCEFLQDIFFEIIFHLYLIILNWELKHYIWYIWYICK
jgi:hypothetical protein